MKLLPLICLLFLCLAADAQFWIERPAGKAWTGKDPIKGVRIFQQFYTIDTTGKRYLFDSSFTQPGIFFSMILLTGSAGLWRISSW